MEYMESCPTCGHTNTVYAFKINKGLVTAFRAVCEKYLETKRPVTKKDLGFLLERKETHQSYMNLPHLKYWGLIDNTAKKTEYFPTELGLAFFYGKATVPLVIAEINGVTVPDTHPFWETYKGHRSNVSIWQVENDYLYKTRDEYVAEKREQHSPQQTMF